MIELLVVIHKKKSYIKMCAHSQSIHITHRSCACYAMPCHVTDTLHRIEAKKKTNIASWMVTVWPNDVFRSSFISFGFGQIFFFLSFCLSVNFVFAFELSLRTCGQCAQSWLAAANGQQYKKKPDANKQKS